MAIILQNRNINYKTFMTKCEKTEFLQQKPKQRGIQIFNRTPKEEHDASTSKFVCQQRETVVPSVFTHLLSLLLLSSVWKPFVLLPQCSYYFRVRVSPMNCRGSPAAVRELCSVEVSRSKLHKAPAATTVPSLPPLPSLLGGPSSLLAFVLPCFQLRLLQSFSSANTAMRSGKQPG